MGPYRSMLNAAGITAKKIEQAKTYIGDGLTVREAAARLKISKTSLYNALRDHKTA